MNVDEQDEHDARCALRAVAISGGASLSRISENLPWQSVQFINLTFYSLRDWICPNLYLKGWGNSLIIFTKCLDKPDNNSLKCLGKSGNAFSKGLDKPDNNLLKVRVDPALYFLDVWINPTKILLEVGVDLFQFVF